MDAVSESIETPFKIYKMRNATEYCIIRAFNAYACGKPMAHNTKIVFAISGI